MSDGTTTWTNTYNSDGLRTSRTNGTTTYNYYYEGSQLTSVSDGDVDIWIFYDGNRPVIIKYRKDGAEDTYHYELNLQGDVIAILDSSGNRVVEYAYDAWGKILSISGSMKDTLGQANPLRYRGYVYDPETGLYYCQSRYYDPKTHRFLNADAFAATGQGFVGNNMFTYCNNNPVNGADPYGTCFHRWDFWNDCEGCGGRTIGEKWNDYWENGLTLAFSVGLYVSVDIGPFNITGSVELAFDLKGNVQVISSCSFDIVPSDTASASAGVTGSVSVIPDTSYFAGDTYNAGGGIFVPNPTGVGAAGVSANVGQSSEGYWSVNGALGIGTKTAAGLEIHGGYTRTVALTEQFNLIESFAYYFH